MQPREGEPGGFGGGLLPDPYDSFMHHHLSYYGYFQGHKMGARKSPVASGDPTEQHPTEALSTGSTNPGHRRGPGQELSSHLAAPRALQRTPGQGPLSPSLRHGGALGEPRGLFAVPSPGGLLPPPRWPVECEVIQERIEHIEWVPPEPEPFCQPTSMEQAPAPLSEEQGTIVYNCSPVPHGAHFTRARVGGAPGPLSVAAAPLEGPQDTTLLFESRFESGNLERAVKVGPYEYVLRLRPDLFTTKHTQWFYFRVQNTRREPLYRFTIANLAKAKSLYGEGMRPLFYSQRDAQSRGIGWRHVGTDVRYYRGAGEREPAAFHLSWTMRFPHDGDTCFFAHSYPYTYTDLQRYLRALMGDPVRSRYCAVRALCRSLAGNTVYVLTITSAGGSAAKRAVVLSARAHPGESGGSWAMRGCLDFLLSADADARLLRRLFVFMVVPMLNPDGVVVGNSRCSLSGRDPNRAYGTAMPAAFPGVWHLRAMVERVLAEREVVLYCDFHGHSRKNNVFMYGCDGGGTGAGLRLHQRIFPLMLSKNAPDKFSFPSCKFKVQKSKLGTGRVVMWRLGVSNSYTLEAAFGGSTLGGRSSHFTVRDLTALGAHLCDSLLDLCDPDPAKLQQCLAELDALLRRRLGRDPGAAGSWSDVAASELESSTSGSDSSVSPAPGSAAPGESAVPPGGLPAACGLLTALPPRQPEPRRRRRLRSRRARGAGRRPSAAPRSRDPFAAAGPPSRSLRAPRARLEPSRPRRHPGPGAGRGAATAGTGTRPGRAPRCCACARR
ncbi:LOW QUALITY PROTEIN: cytosolic carboxypeptidase 2 [Lathamus discolor]|uniref:LOW QUALITY PROTEIN: cytosolic carboxypeptidase 2 n=1 Tax=Lathamus discolor TaxID=678569 RepID=UPI0032B7B935